MPRSPSPPASAGGGASPSKVGARSLSPSSRIPAEVADSVVYKRAMAILSEACGKFNRERDGSFLKEIDNREIDKELFRIQIRGGISCRLTVEEMDSLMPHFDNNGFVNGCEFILLMIRLRSEHRNELLTYKIAKEKEFLAKEKEWQEARLQEAEAKASKMTKINFDGYSAEDLRQATEIITDAAFRYDRAMPGTAQLDAFQCDYLDPATFKDQLRRVFNVHMTPTQIGAFLKHSSFFRDGVINCANFLVFFLRLGFNERANLTRRTREEKLRINSEREQRQAEEQAELATKNALKCSLSFFPDDKDRALRKLRIAAKAYDKAMPGARAVTAFDVLSMPPHVFKEQLKRTFNLKVSARELGALMSVFDEQSTGEINCGEFLKTFLAMGFTEREKDFKANLQLQREADRLRALEDETKALALAGKNQLQLVDSFGQGDVQSALLKLTEAAFRFDKSMPGSPNLTAFESKEMEPSVFKEQLRRAFGMKLSAEELAALVHFFDPKGTGKVSCREFLIMFLKKGFDERAKKAAEWRIISREAEVAMRKEEEEKKAHADSRSELKVPESYSEAEFHSAKEKLVHAALKFHKDPNSSSGLVAFEAEHLPPHVFKEQLKMCFNLKVTMGELAALMGMFDKERLGHVKCKPFLNEFFRIGHEERDKIAAGWRAEQRAAEERTLKEEEEREKEKAERQQREVDFHFLETDFDSALLKFLHMCHGFEQRQLGPAGLSAFTCAYLTPSEFRETFKRTFGVRVGPRELGALVRYFEVPEVRGVVNCTAFLNLFVQLRVHCEGIKAKTASAGALGPALEKRLITEYHAELKNAYQLKLEKQSAMGNGGNARPWQSSVRGAAKKTVTTASGVTKVSGPLPRTPQDKLKLRMNVCKDTGRLDLTTKYRWRDDEGESYIGAMFASAKGGGKLKDKSRKAMKMSHAAASRDAAFAEPGRIKNDFRLHAVPNDVWKLLHLTELWLDNHSLGWLPSELGDLVQLEVLSVGGNSMEELPAEICKLTKLRRFVASRNVLTTLPENFHHLQLLSDVDLSFNSFSVFPMALTMLPRLLTLQLQKTDISELPMELRQLRSLSFLNLEGCPIKKAPPVLGHMNWADVNGCLIPQAPRAAFRFKITEEDAEEIEEFLRHRAASRKIAHLRRKTGKTGTRSQSQQNTSVVVESSVNPAAQLAEGLSASLSLISASGGSGTPFEPVM